MENFRDLYEHHWIIEMGDEGIVEAKKYFNSFFKDNEGDFFECTEKEAKKAQLHRFVSASAFGRYQTIYEKNIGGAMSLDVAFPRNEKNWFETLPQKLTIQIELKLILISLLELSETSFEISDSASKSSKIDSLAAIPL